MSISSITSSITSTSASTTPPATGGVLSGSKDEFLRLFMAQLEHQDPLNPQDGASMVAQLAQFSTVEQAQQTNQHLADLAAAQASTSSAGMASLVGRTCNAGATDFQLDRGGAPPPLQLTATSAMNGASVVITDDSGKEVRRLPVPAGTSSALIAWDGNTAAGVPAAPGSYHITVDPGSTGASTINSQWHGRVDAVELTSDGPRLRMGGVLIAPSDVQTIGQSTP
jgi:flagellar basal-body rod modification protein FlgD